MGTRPPEAADWSRERIEQAAAGICDPARIRQMLADAGSPDRRTVQDLLHSAVAMAGLAPEHVGVLAQVTDPALRELVLDAARKVHARAYGRRISLVAPVCPTNRCVNDCAYCPLRQSNSRLRRTFAGSRETQREVVALLDEGYRHVNLVFGDDRSGVHYIRDSIWATYGSRSGLRQVQRVDVNVNPLRVSELSQLHQAGRLGTYHVYQETYDPAAFAALHPAGPKADYALRLACHDIAFSAGLNEMGLGILLGAGDLAFDLVALTTHFRYLEREYGVAPRAVTLPRMIPSPGAPASREEGRQVSDDDFRYVFALMRLAAPYVDLVLCTPASRDVRLELYGLGVSQVSVGSASYPGVYTADGDPGAAGGLTIGRPRGLESLVYRMADSGFIPNFCVNCYTPRRRSTSIEEAHPRPCVGERCSANALLGLKEYMMDYATPDTQVVGARLIQHELARLTEPVREATLELMEETEAGIRGLSIQ
jgi:2-iminoacetate synthase